MKIERTFDGTGWAYADDITHAAAIDFLLVHRFDLSAFDDWLEGPGWEADELAVVLDMRQRAIDAHTANNADATEAWVERLADLLQANARERFLHPLAVKGRKHGQAQAKRRKDKPAASPDDLGRNERLQRYHAGLTAAGRADATSATAAEFNLSTRTVRRVLTN